MVALLPDVVSSCTTCRKKGPDERRWVRRAPSGSQLDGKSARYTGQGAALAHAPKQGLEGGLAWNFHVPRRAETDPECARRDSGVVSAK